MQGIWNYSNMNVFNVGIAPEIGYTYLSQDSVLAIPYYSSPSKVTLQFPSNAPLHLLKTIEAFRMLIFGLFSTLGILFCKAFVLYKSFGLCVWRIHICSYWRDHSGLMIVIHGKTKKYECKMARLHTRMSTTNTSRYGTTNCSFSKFAFSCSR